MGPREQNEGESPPTKNGMTEGMGSSAKDAFLLVQNSTHRDHGEFLPDTAP